jgi:hypothetical protein
MSINQLTPSQLRQAADLQERIAKLQNELATIFGSETKAPTIQAAKPAKRKMSASAIAKIRAAQKARWAKIKATKAIPAPAPKAVAASVPAAKPVKKGRSISTEARAKMAAAAKARWAKVKAAKK